MPQTSSRLWRLLRDLALALINATLLLAALCLFLGLRIVSTVDATTERITQSVVAVERLHGDLQTVGEELSALRAELAALRQSPLELPPEMAAALEARLADFDARMAALDEAIARAGETGEALRTAARQGIDRAVDRGVAALADEIAALAGCVLPRGPDLSDPPLPLREKPPSG
ncbi:hypothetical protein [Tropicimonas sp. IMCC6043]|uniref:hypothetical protein n=1 Tax=Tropicimonas sp. IMCC6043 TaxID=2510645 RepID=UPI00101C7839|nr:hypothetical protein [Tropicimonas sp. IMCC6043]RYH11811.1 hypothetical protein EU800_04035 [Tropicimonas sp. IMCC6043]